MSLEQLLTIFNQLHVILYNKNFDQKEEWIAVGSCNEIFYLDVTFEGIYFLAEAWIERGLSPDQLSDLTRGFLRGNLVEWADYELAWRRKSFLDRASKIYNDDYDFTFGGEEECIRDYIKTLESHLKKEKDLANEFYPKISKQNKDKWPFGWMLTNKGLREVMEKKKGQRRVKLFNELWRNKMSSDESQAILSGMKIKKMRLRIWLSTFRSEKINPVLVKVNMALMGNKLGGVSAETVRSDVESLEKAGALKKIGKPGPHEHSVYAIGKAITYYPNDTTEIGVKKIRTVPLLKKSPHAISQLKEAFQ